MLEDIEHLLSKSALLSLLGLIGNVGIIIAVVTYVGTEKQRRDAEILNAWQTITNAAGEPGNGGRIRALQFLNASPGANWRRKFPWFCAPHPLCTWDGESLAGINLSVAPIPEAEEDDSGNIIPGVFLEEIELPGADLLGANLEGAHLKYANLEGADLRDANLEGAFLWSADLEGAFLGFANLEGAFLGFVNLEEANLGFVNLEGADLFSTNLEGAQNLTEEQLTQAKLCETILPEDITLDPDRDCEELGIPQPSQ